MIEHVWFFPPFEQADDAKILVWIKKGIHGYQNFNRVCVLAYLILFGFGCFEQYIWIGCLEFLAVIGAEWVT